MINDDNDNKKLVYLSHGVLVTNNTFHIQENLHNWVHCEHRQHNRTGRKDLARWPRAAIPAYVQTKPRPP